MMMNSDLVLTCYVVVRMFQQNYRKSIRINNREAWADDCGFVYHNITLDMTETPLDEGLVPHSYGQRGSKVLRDRQGMALFGQGR
jgi:hypothetical protein